MKKSLPFASARSFIFAASLLPLSFSLWAQEIIPPQCYGGSRLTREFIQEEMIYPARALESKTEGTVILTFMVLPDGSVNDVRVLQHVSPDLDREALRIFSKILWHPATQLGKPISYRREMEIKFKIKKYMKFTNSKGPEYFVNPHSPVDSSIRIYVREDLDKAPKPLFSILDRDFGTFLTNNLEYPETAFKQNISGTVELMFVVEVSGRVSNIQVEKYLGGGCTEEAIRVLKLIKWYPGIKDNMAVRTVMPLQITFDIAKKSVGGAIPSPGQLH